MSKTLNSENFGEKLYNSLPEIYRTDDASVGFTLKKYLQALSDGGFSKVIEETNNLLAIVDSEKVDFELLPLLFKSYGLEIFNGVQEIYLRKLLPTISKLFSLKGSITSVEYITSLISGVKSTVEISDHFNTDHSVSVTLDMDYNTAHSETLIDKEHLQRIIKEFIPFYCTVVIIYSYFFVEEARTYIQDLFSKDTVHITNADSGTFSFNDIDLPFKVIDVTEEPNVKPVCTDFNSFTNDPNSVLGTTFLLNNIRFYDTIKIIENVEKVISKVKDSFSQDKLCTNNTDYGTLNIDDNGLSKDKLCTANEDQMVLKVSDNDSLIKDKLFIKHIDLVELKIGDSDLLRDKLCTTNNDILGLKVSDADLPLKVKETDYARPIFSDVNSLTNDLKGVLCTTFLLNNVRSYDIIRTNGKEINVFV